MPDGDEVLAADGTKFGRAMRDRFLLADGFQNFNHGSFGSVPKVVSDAQRAYSLQCEARPDKWFRQDYFVCVDSARSMLAAYINAPSADDLVMVENASGAVNSVMRSMNWEAGGIILYLSSAYAMVKNTASWLARSSSGTVQNVEVSLGPDFPMAGDASVLNPLRDALKKHKGKVRLLVVSHITSVPAATLPIAEILALARSPEALGSGAAFPVLVDGAHALGQIDIDLQAMGDPDFYVSNAHKWLYAPKGSAFLYVRRDRQEANFPEPTVISSSGKQDFIGRYAYTGSRDYTPFCSVVNAFEFRASLGEAQIKAYVMGLASWAAQHLAAKWGTRVLCPPHMQAFMFNVQVRYLCLLWACIGMYGMCGYVWHVWVCMACVVMYGMCGDVCHVWGCMYGIPCMIVSDLTHASASVTHEQHRRGGRAPATPRHRLRYVHCGCSHG